MNTAQRIVIHKVNFGDVHGNGIPNGTGNPMGMGINTEFGMGMGGMGNHLSGNGNYLHSHGNLFPKVLCCDELIKLIIKG